MTYYQILTVVLLINASKINWSLPISSVPLHLDVVGRLLAALERGVQVGLADGLVDVLLLEAHHLLDGFILTEEEMESIRLCVNEAIIQLVQ